MAINIERKGMKERDVGLTTAVYASEAADVAHINMRDFLRLGQQNFGITLQTSAGCSVTPAITLADPETAMHPENADAYAQVPWDEQSATSSTGEVSVIDNMHVRVLRLTFDGPGVCYVATS